MTVRWLATVLAMLLSTVACVGATDAAQPATLAELVADPERFDARRVIAEGIVRRHDDPLHTWLEDAEVNRVELEPSDAVVELVGSTIRVTGVFRAPGEEGRAIEVEDVEVLREPAEAVARMADRSSSAATTARVGQGSWSARPADRPLAAATSTRPLPEPADRHRG